MGFFDSLFGGSTSPKMDPATERFKQSAFNYANYRKKETQLPFDVAMNQLLELLTTGGLGVRMPIYGKAQESSMKYASQGQKQLEEQLARQGLSGTPFGANVMGDYLTDALMKVSQVVPQMQYEDFYKMLNMLLPVLMGGRQQGGDIMRALAGASSASPGKGGNMAEGLGGLAEFGATAGKGLKELGSLIGII